MQMPMKRFEGGEELATASTQSSTDGSALSHFKMAVVGRLWCGWRRQHLHWLLYMPNSRRVSQSGSPTVGSPADVVIVL